MGEATLRVGKDRQGRGEEGEKEHARAALAGLARSARARSGVDALVPASRTATSATTFKCKTGRDGPGRDTTVDGVLAHRVGDVVTLARVEASAVVAGHVPLAAHDVLCRSSTCQHNATSEEKTGRT